MDPWTESLVRWSGSPILARYLLAAVLLGGVALAGLVLRWAGRRLLYGRPIPPRRRTLPDGLRVQVDRVIDGDTLDVIAPGREEEPIRVRVLGLDTPETRRGEKVRRDAERAGSSVTQQIELGRSATRRARALLEGQQVELEAAQRGQGIGEDVYGRALAYVRLPDGRDFGLVMIQEGQGECFGWKYPHPRGQAYRDAEEQSAPWWRRLLG